MSEIKDKKITIYGVKTDRDLWGNEIKIRRYLCLKSGIWAYVRELSEREKFAAKATGSEQTTVFKIGYMPSVCAGLYIEFNGGTYRVESVNGFEFYRRDLTLRCVRTVAEVTDHEEYP